MLAGAAALTLRPTGATADVGAAAKKRSLSGWDDYEARLRARLADAGGGRFDLAAGRELAALTDRARAAADTPPCAWDEALAETARAHAADLAGRAYVEHLSPEGFDPSDRLGLLGRRMIGSTSENIAYHRGPDPAGAAQLMRLWRNSPQHWMNLLRAKHSHAAFGVVRKADRVYAVGLYARPDGTLAAPLPFRLRQADELASSVSDLPADVSALWLDDHVHGGPGLRVSSLRQFAETPAGVYRLRLDRRVGARAYESLWGPIFIWSPLPQG